MKYKVICGRGDWEKEYESDDRDKSKSDAAIDLGIHMVQEHGMDMGTYKVKYSDKPNG